MRPIELTVKGLHSFREKQTVNFKSLCDGGVFGIFGPTGSGKSSLLDAITLALYGKVERAGGSTQGILNHAEDELSVTFTFELGIEASERYRVERVYKRSKTDGLTIGSCRLLHFKNEEAFVLADKERDVSQKVKDILGLTHEDFTRAVVLPQGKFAEFLSLQGAKRRQMLQRLFNMEKYGDRLTNVIRGRLNQATNRLEVILSAEQELGDASKEALEHSKLSHITADKRVKALSQSFQEMKEKLDVAKQKKEWQDSLQKALESEQYLATKSQEIDVARDRLNKARTAALVLPYVNDYEAVERELHHSRIEQEAADKIFKEISQLEHEKKQIMESISKRMAEAIPINEKKRENLRHAVQLNNEIRTKSEAFDELKEKLEQHRIAMEETQAKSRDMIEKRQKIQSDLETLRGSLKEVRVSADERELVAKAISEKHEIENKRASLNEWHEQWKTLQNSIGENETAAENEKKKLDKIVESLRALFSRYEAGYFHVSSIKKVLDMILDWLIQKEDECQVAIQNLDIANLASELSSHLRDGAPCPVCGSIHHPEPAKVADDSQVVGLKEKAQFYRQCSQWINRAITSVGNYQVALEQKVSQIRNLSSALIPGITPRKESILPDLANWDDENLKGFITQTKEDLQGFKQDSLELDERLKPLIEQFKSISNQYLVYSTQRNEYGKQELTVSEKVKVIKAGLDERLQTWKADYPYLDYQTLEKEQDRIKALDRKANALNEQIEKFTQDLATLESEKQNVDSVINNHQQQFIRLDESMKGLGAMIETLMTDYKNAMDGAEDDATIALEKLESEMISLKENDEKARDEWEITKESRFKAEKSLSNAVELFKSKNKQAEEKGAILIEQLKLHGAASPEAVKEAVLTNDMMKHEEEMIKQYDQNVNQVRTEIEGLKEKIGSDPISNEAYESMIVAIKELGENRDKALEERAAHYKDWQLLIEKHDRFTQLEKEREEVSELQSQLQKLSSIFRGNGFVEYIAEEQMEQICRDASERLGHLTHRRYALEVDSGGGFVIRDDANGGIRRPVSSLSGGETFLTSLALALSLSTQIQLRGEVPLQFFFLDEGFGTLDQELLDTVITALEKLQTENLAIGVISHVPELQERLARKLFVESAEPSGRGSRLRLTAL